MPTALAGLSQLQTYRQALYTARLDIINGGSSGSVTGSFAFQNWTIDQINAEIFRVERKIFRIRGYSTKNIQPDFS